VIQSMTQIDGNGRNSTATSVGGTEETTLLISIPSVDMSIIKSFRIAMQQNALQAIIDWRMNISENAPDQISSIELDLRDELSTSLYEFEQWKRTIEQVYKKQMGLKCNVLTRIDEIYVLKSTYANQAKSLEQRLSSIKNEYGESINELNGHSLLFEKFAQTTMNRVPSTNRPDVIQLMVTNLDSRYADLSNQITSSVDNAKQSFLQDCVFIKNARRTGTPWHPTAWNILETKLMVTVKSGKSWDPVAALETWRDSFEPKISKNVQDSEKLLVDTKRELLSHIDDCNLLEETSGVVQKLRLNLKAESVVSGNYMQRLTRSIANHVDMRDHCKQSFSSLNKLVGSVEEIRRDVSAYGAYLNCIVSEKDNFSSEIIIPGFADWQNGRMLISSVDASSKTTSRKGSRKSSCKKTKSTPVSEIAPNFSALIEESRSACRETIAKVCEVKIQSFISI
jgi:hypothetical protein